MASRAPSRTKRSDIRELINEWINRAVDQGRSFSPVSIRDYYEAGIAAREERRERAMREVTPRRESEIGELVFKRVEQTRGPVVGRQITEEAFSAALDLGEMLELGRLDIKQWVRS